MLRTCGYLMLMGTYCRQTCMTANIKIWKMTNFISVQNLLRYFPQDPQKKITGGGLRTGWENRQKLSTMLWDSDNQKNLPHLSKKVKPYKRYTWVVLRAWFPLISKDIAHRLLQSWTDSTDNRSDCFICRSSLASGEVVQVFFLTTCQCTSTQPQRNHF